MAYDVQTDLYDGPLTLLVELSKFQLLDVFLVKLQALTSQYREWLAAEHLSLDQISEPLPLLGQLVAIKAKLLLPKPPAPEDNGEEQISLEELQRRLAEYEQFKSVAQVLSELRALQHQYFNRIDPGGTAALPGAAAIDPNVPIEIGLGDLVTAFTDVLQRSKTPVYEVSQDPWTVEMKVDELRLMLTTRGQVKFRDLFSAEKTRLELVVTFLALLELVRQRLCKAVQERHFGDIMIVRRETT